MSAKIENTQGLREKILDAFKAPRPLTHAQQEALSSWVRDGSWLVLHHKRPDLAVEDEDKWIFASVSAGIVAGFFDVTPSVDLVRGLSSCPMVALQVGAAVTDAALWCIEVCAALEAAAVESGVPAHNRSGTSGVARVCVKHKLKPALPVPFPKG